MRRTMIFVALAGALVLGWTFMGAPGSSAQSDTPPEPELILYSGPNFTGRSLRVTGTLYDLPSGTDRNGNEYTWNDRVRSLVVVSGTFVLYQHGRANTVLDDTAIEEFDRGQKTPEPGWSCLISASSTGPVEFPESSVAPWHDDISSIRLVSEKNLPDWAVKGY